VTGLGSNGVDQLPVTERVTVPTAKGTPGQPGPSLPASRR
jgi:hypothetical protein